MDKIRQCTENLKRAVHECEAYKGFQKARKELDLNDPNKTFEQLIEQKMQRKGLNRDEAMKDILETATKTRKSVNRMLGLE